jgi:uncharacterized lipoprotein
MKFIPRIPGPLPVLIASLALLLAGCESGNLSLTKRIDYKSASSTPSLELPPDLTTPRYDDRYQVNSASGLAAQNASKSGRGDLLPTNPDAKIVRAGSERWLVVKSTPEQSWNTVRSFWQENGFSIAVDQPTSGVMETDWAENRVNAPQDFLQRTMGKVADVFGGTYKRDKFRTRIERGVEPGTVEIFISARAMEQVPTTTIDHAGAAFVWAVVPPSPETEAEMLTRLMMKFGAPEPAARMAVAQAAICRRRRGSKERGRLLQAHRRRSSSIAHGAGSAWHSTASDSPLSTATVPAACTSSASATRTSQGHGELVGQAEILEHRREEQAGAIPDRGRRDGADQRGQRAGPGRHTRPDGDERTSSSAAQVPTQVTRNSGAFRVDRQRQRG